MGRFTAMASPCEVLVDTDDVAEAAPVVAAAADEALRIERAHSRDRDDNVVHRINHARGEPVTVDEETASLLDYAAECWAISNGKFDVTSGVLRRVWTFDGGDRVPRPEQVLDVLRHVGWRRVRWRKPVLTMPACMEIDFGGIGKEYAVDRAAARVAALTSCPFLIHFGGDHYASGPRRGGRPWVVGIDDPARPGEAARWALEFERGGIATSGDARRYVTWQGRRLPHILDPLTGWPVEGAPRSITVLDATCLEAGTLATLAMLEGPRAEEFLREQGVRYWIG